MNVIFIINFCLFVCFFICLLFGLFLFFRIYNCVCKFHENKIKNLLKKIGDRRRYSFGSPLLSRVRYYRRWVSTKKKIRQRKENTTRNSGNPIRERMKIHETKLYHRKWNSSHSRDTKNWWYSSHSRNAGWCYFYWWLI